MAMWSRVSATTRSVTVQVVLRDMDIREGSGIVMLISTITGIDGMTRKLGDLSLKTRLVSEAESISSLTSETILSASGTPKGYTLQSAAKITATHTSVNMKRGSPCILTTTTGMARSGTILAIVVRTFSRVGRRSILIS